MNRRLVACLALALAPITSATTSATEPTPTTLAGSRPNIIVILADDLGFSDLGCYGADIIQTPNLDRLGYGGLRFTQFYNNAKCGPSRATLLTGLYSQQVGCQGPPVKMRNCVTLGEALRLAGYQTFLSGKWHAKETPYQRGFDHAFGLCDGHCNYWNPGEQRPTDPAPPAFWAPSKGGEAHHPRWAIDDREYEVWTPEDPDFYTTDAFTDHALDYIRAAAQDERPFLLHLAYTAPHFPLQARPEDIAKYRGKFHVGWDELRRRRYQHLLALGLIDPHWPLPPRDEAVPAWDDVEDPEEMDLLMAVYAAMIDRLDQNIGRVLDTLEQTGQRENTLILFLSDNGGTEEDYGFTPDKDPGPLDSFRFVTGGWANASNTPFRKFKAYDHEGGVSTPFIANWPGHIAPGGINRDVGHIIDIMPTLLELAGGAYPTEHDGEVVLPMEGSSLVPLFTGGQRSAAAQIGWNYWRASALREGDWKVVRYERDAPWELYNLATDRSELHDQAAARPELTARLTAAWLDWAHRVGVRNP